MCSRGDALVEFSGHHAADALVYGEYRVSPHSSSECAHSVLPAAGGDEGDAGAADAGPNIAESAGDFFVFSA